MNAKTIPPEIQAPLDKIGSYLEPYGLTATLDQDPDGFKENEIGEYENGSVFEKNIIFRINTDNIREAAKEECMYYMDFYLEQCRITVYHEIGHALMEQLIDWTENLEEMEALLDGQFGKTYYDIFNDDNCTEEEIVEDFAKGFDNEKPSLLQRCWEEANKLISV